MTNNITVLIIEPRLRLHYFHLTSVPLLLVDILSARY
jgi:hypothetical protein